MDSSEDRELSYDPRSWASTPDAGARPAQAPTPAPTAARRAPDRRLILAGGGLVGAVALGGAWFAWSRRAAPRGADAGATAAPAGAVRRSLVIAGPGDLDEALAGAGLPPKVVAAAVQPTLAVLGAGGGELRVSLALSAGVPPVLLQLEVRRADGSGVVARPAAGGAFEARPLAANLAKRVKVVRGEMDANSFYSSAVTAGVTDSLISDFANAFAFDFDFQREIKPGDIFEAAFAQQVNDAGEAVGPERLLYVALQTEAKSRALYRFQSPGEAEAAWFDGAGSSVVRSLMRTPVEGARVTSNFGPRTHPVLGYTRVHKGTDFAAPVGTPVYASGDGVVDFVGVHGGHGNYVRVRHNPTLQTAYAHLSSYGAGIAVGAAVRQGQQIALSGNTGLSSGPHLHYEVIVNDGQVDPLTYQTESGRKLQGPALAGFLKERDAIDALRAAQNG